jgi:hypothetical protein
MSDIFDFPVEDCITLICSTCGCVIRAALPNYPDYFIAEGVCRQCEAKAKGQSEDGEDAVALSALK